MKKLNGLLILLIIMMLFVVSCKKESALAKGFNVTIGSSINISEEKAAIQAVKMINKKITNPDLVLMYSTVGYDLDILTNTINENIGDPSKILGVTSCYGVFTNKGVLVGEKGSIVMMAIESPDIEVGVGFEEVTSETDIRSTAVKALQNALIQINKTKQDKPDLIYLATYPGYEETIIDAISNEIGYDVPIYGGSAADNTIEDKGFIFAGGRLFSKAVAVALVYSNVKLSYDFENGFGYKNHSGNVTKSGERVVYEIDNQPAGKVYNKWADMRFKEGENILSQSSFAPLAKKVEYNGEDIFISVHPKRIDPIDGSLHLFADVANVETVYFIEGNANDLIERPRKIIDRALAKAEMKRSNIFAGTIIYCGGSMLAIKDNIDEIIPIIAESMGNKPFIGAFTFGEQGYIPGYGNFHGNLMNSVVLFGE